MAPDSPLDFEAVLDAQPIRSFQILTIVLSGFLGLIDGFDTQVIALIAPCSPWPNRWPAPSVS